MRIETKSREAGKVELAQEWTEVLEAGRSLIDGEIGAVLEAERTEGNEDRVREALLALVLDAARTDWHAAAWLFESGGVRSDAGLFFVTNAVLEASKEDWRAAAYLIDMWKSGRYEPLDEPGQ